MKNTQSPISFRLKQYYVDEARHNKKNPLDELIFIICSIKRSEKVYLQAFNALNRKFPSYAKMSAATFLDIRDTLAPFGLQNEKAKTIKDILSSISKHFGKLSLAPLKNWNDQECEEFLMSLRGVGKKVARCVMMYSLGRNVFPVDSNCWRVGYRLGWVNWTSWKTTISANDMDLLQNKIPARLRYSLHENMVFHGRKICTPINPKCNICPISTYCPSF